MPTPRTHQPSTYHNAPHEIETANICSGQKSTRTWDLVQSIPVQTLPVVVAHFLNNPLPITLTYLTFVIEISQTPLPHSTAPLGALSAYAMRQVYSQFPVVVQPHPLATPSPPRPEAFS